MILDLNSILLLIVIFQFLFMGTFLLTNKKGKRISNILFGIICITLVISLSEMLITMNGYYDLLGLFAFMDLVLMLLYGPLIFLYTKSVIYKNFIFKMAYLFHLLPFVLMGVLVTINYVNTPDELKLAALEKIYNYQLTFQQAVVVVPFYLHILVYMALAVNQIKRYKRVILEDYSDLKPYSLDWLNFLIRSFLAVTLISLLLSMFPYTQFNNLTGYALVLDILLTFFIINQIVFKALRQPELFSGIDEGKKYHKSSLTEADKTQTASALDELMKNEQPYLESGLTLAAISEMLGMKDRDVSQVINEKRQASFHDYVNKHRIEHAKEIMENSPDLKLTMLEILYQSGFNSKSSFNTAFKKHTSLTPTQYKELFLRKE